MAQKKAQEWSNTPVSPDEEMTMPTPHEKHVAELAEKNKDTKPQRYDITSKNARALRVLYDFNGRSVAIPPNETKCGVLLHPGTVARLGQGDLEFHLAQEGAV